ncbi:MAG TPA: NAD-dependent epimerase/dehydratase family protein, partial [Verrucomicrobiae bacterium]|nr:NAD-dependent epimerase/dehydratase family protein [Verrucomicrobiae bacterium]
MRGLSKEKRPGPLETQRSRSPGSVRSPRPSDHRQAKQGSAPDALLSEAELDEFLTRPRRVLVDFIRNVPSPLLVLGAGGKMGPTLCVLAKRAAEAARKPLEVIAVSRFSDSHARRWLEERGVGTLSADLLQRRDVERLPDAANLIYLVGLKFGTQENPSLTWAVNTVVPAYVLERFPKARVAALSTGNVYPLASARSHGAGEATPLTPLGEYPNAAVARERVFEYFSRRNGTPVALLRLNYAVELRYGVLADIARNVFTRKPVDLGNGYFNCIWQGDANEMILRALDLARSPATVWNLTSPRSYSVRKIALSFGALL